MPVPEMLKAIERLRMLLSVIRDKDEELRALRRDFPPPARPRTELRHP